MQSEHSETSEGEMGGDAQQSIVVLLLEAEDDAEAGTEGTPGEVAAAARNTFPRW
jgi:hypothetical protein